MRHLTIFLSIINTSRVRSGGGAAEEPCRRRGTSHLWRSAAQRRRGNLTQRILTGRRRFFTTRSETTPFCEAIWMYAGFCERRARRGRRRMAKQNKNGRPVPSSSTTRITPGQEGFDEAAEPPKSRAGGAAQAIYGEVQNARRGSCRDFSGGANTTSTSLASARELHARRMPSASYWSEATMLHLSRQ